MLEELFEDTLDLSDWDHYGTGENYVYNDISIPGLRQDAYRRTLNGQDVSIGVFHYYDRPAYAAWGFKNETHCSFHAPLSPSMQILEVRPGCPDVAPIKNDTGEVTGFILDKIETFK